MKTITIKNKEYVAINSVARKVVSGGFSYDYKGNQEKIFEAPPTPFPVPKNTQNLIGTKRGKIKIVGYYGRTVKGKSEKQKWIGRCVCGRYVLRSGRKWRNGLKNKTADSCPFCKNIEYLKKHAAYLENRKMSDSPAEH